MLVLSRKKEESLIIGDNIEIKIVDIEEGKVKIGIVAPKNVTINRKEVYDKIKEENEKSINSKENVKQLQEIKKFIKK